jgi:2-oxoglutarate/2-oxoacid ferredoxin oxidoreductase subunit beta
MSDTVVNLTTKKDWTSDQEVRWCPGCGDYGILQAVQQLMPELGVAPPRTPSSCRASDARAACRTT